MDDITKHIAKQCDCVRCKTELAIDALQEAMNNKGTTLIREESDKLFELGAEAFNMDVVKEDFEMFRAFVALAIGCAMLGSDEKDIESSAVGATLIAGQIIKKFSELRRAQRIVRTMNWMDAATRDPREG